LHYGNCALEVLPGNGHYVGAGGVKGERVVSPHLHHHAAEGAAEAALAREAQALPMLLLKVMVVPTLAIMVEGWKPLEFTVMEAVPDTVTVLVVVTVLPPVQAPATSSALSATTANIDKSIFFMLTPVFMALISSILSS
jgi:hypothetical protein